MWFVCSGWQHCPMVVGVDGVVEGGSGCGVIVLKLRLWWWVDVDGHAPQQKAVGLHDQMVCAQPQGI